MVHRTGYEPVQARSPLRLRLALALVGVVSGAAAAVGLALVGQPGWAAVCAAIALIAAIDAGVVVHHIRQGPHYQPGRDVPPYRPVDEEPRPRHKVPH
ncbi:DUF6343 family protein [Actinacidiphila guanduensis]|jgi:hypothetical protein|uniref:Uncharacterized protein n=1 Tax=Actinacidiphila guanduensis TaxID=310781 RepID=A0A1H0RH08_9ACTN|nr:DUF6343 family protein [Actinacidiphila guanduensis]SDP28695.1 hypothetical protein SAMN05216259_12215 [Actinacidiphila guanduensis]